MTNEEVWDQEIIEDIEDRKLDQLLREAEAQIKKIKNILTTDHNSVFLNQFNKIMEE